MKQTKVDSKLIITLLIWGLIGALCALVLTFIFNATGQRLSQAQSAGGRECTLWHKQLSPCSYCVILLFHSPGGGTYIPLSSVQLHYAVCKKSCRRNHPYSSPVRYLSLKSGADALWFSHGTYNNLQLLQAPHITHPICGSRLRQCSGTGDHFDLIKLYDFI